ARRLKLAHPGVRLQQQMQRLDELAQRLGGAAHAGLHRDQMRLAHAITALVRRSPDQLVREYRVRHQGAGARLEHAAGECLSRAQHRLALAQRALNAVSPLATLARGFAIVTRATSGTLLTDAAAVAAGEEIEARLARGSAPAAAGARSGRRRPAEPGCARRERATGELRRAAGVGAAGAGQMARRGGHSSVTGPRPRAAAGARGRVARDHGGL
ncbi:MAG: hypothetical protein E6K50_06775, partial [Gammaproteobacteria bacterium]